ncbi:MAG TPA: phytanoyl-CoA dioxygenase, partial [Mycobacterium sp.]
PFGRAMEALDRTAMVRAVYPVLRAMAAAGRPHRDLENVVVATAEGYAFPTNLDSDQPIGSLAPPSQVDIVLEALADDLAAEDLDNALRAQNERRTP